MSESDTAPAVRAAASALTALTALSAFAAWLGGLAWAPTTAVAGFTVAVLVVALTGPLLAVIAVGTGVAGRVWVPGAVADATVDAAWLVLAVMPLVGVLASVREPSANEVVASLMLVGAAGFVLRVHRLLGRGAGVPFLQRVGVTGWGVAAAAVSVSAVAAVMNQAGVR